jgi:hypothetical protein
MRLMSFALTEAPFIAGTKDVTRRLGWLHAEAGDHVCGVRKTMGLQPGEAVERWRVIEFVNVRREPLSLVDDREAAREGFPDLTGPQFIEFFISEQGGTPATILTRLEFVHLWTPAGMEIGGYVAQLDAEAKAARREQASRARQVRRGMKRAPPG